MSSSNDAGQLAILIILVAAAAGLFSYSGYWAFTIRRVLAGQIYRRQAMWVAIAGAFFGVFFVFAAASIAVTGGEVTSNNLSVQVFGDLFTVAGFVIIFAWIDATIRVARRSDPLHRNTLHWAGLRYFILIGTSLGLFFTLIPAPPYPHQQATIAASAVQGYPLLAPIGIALFLGGIALLLSARRSKDMILRRHLRWFGIFIIFLYVTNRVEQEVFSRPFLLADSISLEIVTFALFIVAGYLLYRSARSLTPINRYPIDAIGGGER